MQLVENLTLKYKFSHFLKDIFTQDLELHY